MRGPRSLAVIALAIAAACSSYRGTARDTSPNKLATEPGWIWIRNVPGAKQQGVTECGPVALAMVVGFWTGKPTQSIVDSFRPVPDDGVAAGKLRDYAREQGLASYLIEGKLDDLAREVKAGRPVLVGVSKPQSAKRVFHHYEVVVGVNGERQKIATLDPQTGGLRENTVTGFYKEWQLAGFVTLVVSAKAPPATATTP